MSNRRSKISHFTKRLVIFGAIVIVLLFIILFFLTMRMTNELQNRINERLSYISTLMQKDGNKLGFSAFSCNGTFKYTCKSDLVHLESKKYGTINMSNINIIIKDINAKDDFEINAYADLKLEKAPIYKDILENILPNKVELTAHVKKNKAVDNDFLNLALNVKAISNFSDTNIKADSNFFIQKSDKNINIIFQDLINEYSANQKDFYAHLVSLNNINIEKTIKKDLPSIINESKDLDKHAKDSLKVVLNLFISAFANGIKDKLAIYTPESSKIGIGINDIAEARLQKMMLDLNKKSTAEPLKLQDFIATYLNGDYDFSLDNIANDYELRVKIDEKN